MNILFRYFKKKLPFFEVIGLFILLASFGWQQFESFSVGLSSQNDLYEVHRKLDTVWGLIADDYSRKYGDELTSISSTDFSYSLDNWKYWGELKSEKEAVEKQKELAKKIRIWLYVCGSLLILIAKYNETRKQQYA